MQSIAGANSPGKGQINPEMPCGAQITHHPNPAENWNDKWCCILGLELLVCKDYATCLNMLSFSALVWISLIYRIQHSQVCTQAQMLTQLTSQHTLSYTYIYLLTHVYTVTCISHNIHTNIPTHTHAEAQILSHAHSNTDLLENVHTCAQ